MKYRLLPIALAGALFFSSCAETKDRGSKKAEPQVEEVSETSSDFPYLLEEFADIKILNYQIPGWENLSAKQKEYVYYLVQAGLEGRDIFWDQNYKYNLKIRKALENIYISYEGDKDAEDWKNFEIYLKRVWFANGIHHHYSNNKFNPHFSKEYFQTLLEETQTDLEENIIEIIFNEEDSKKVNLDISKGLVSGSAVNFYGPGVTTDQVDQHYAKMKSPDPEKPLSFGLNSKLVKQDGKLEDQVWKSGGMYGPAIDKIIGWLEKAAGVAENEKQTKALELLIDFYKTGDLQTWDDYSVAWTQATDGDIDFINGFIEVYDDPKGYKATFESVVQITDFEMSEQMQVVGEYAQWFEDNSPIMDEHKKQSVVGVIYKTVNVAGLAGATSPASPIGINLPNQEWIREHVGSKSVSLHNIIHSYSEAGGSERLKEFAYTKEEAELSKKYGEVADNIHTTLHEVIGHASGRLNTGVGEPKETLKSYASTIEEGRADLVGLYYMRDPKMQELGLTDDYKKLSEAGYNDYIRNGLLTQLIRIELGDDIEESHMRNRAWISHYVYEKGKEDNLIEKKSKDGKTYFVINDHDRLREYFGELLREVQRIKSEGDYEAAKELVETYGVKIDPKIHQEVLNRNENIATAPYGGFANPILTPVTDEDGNITDIEVSHPKSFAEQMLNYSKNFSNLPLEN